MSSERLFALPVLLAASLAVLLALLLAAALPAAAQSLPDAPDAPGSIAGTVTAEGGAPLAGIEVQIYRLFRGHWLLERTTTTDAQGAYRVGVLGAGTYRTGFRDPGNRYGQSFYAAALTLEGATEITVTGNDVAGIDGVLKLAGAITGSYSTTGRFSNYSYPLGIEALVNVGGAWQAAASAPITTTGPFTLAGLQPSVYRVCIGAFIANSLEPVRYCYEDVVTGVDNAQPVTVTAGLTTTGIDLTAGVAGDGATIGGVARAVNGGAVAGITVRLSLSPPADQLGETLETTTDATGYYTISGLTPGTYQVAFIDNDARFYLTQYYSHTVRAVEASPIAVGRNEARLDVDATLVPGAEVNGALRILGEKPQFAGVTVQDADRIESSVTSYDAYDPDSGMFRVHPLAPGRYKICVTAFLGGVAFFGCYGGASAADAEVIPVSQGATATGLDINLGEGEFDGAISGTVTAGGQPLPAIKVTLYSPYTGGFPPDSALVDVFTDAQGRYTIGGLPRGGYLVGFRDPRGTYATQYYFNNNSLDRATVILVDPITQVVGIDAQLIPGGTLSGRVVRENDEPVANRPISIWRAIGWNEGWIPDRLDSINEQVTTDADGVYRLAGLAPGVFYVCTGGSYLSLPAPDPIYSNDGCYGAPLLLRNPFLGQPAIVRAGQETAHVDIYIGRTLPERAYLPAVARE